MFFFKKTSEKRKLTTLSKFSLAENGNNYQKPERLMKLSSSIPEALLIFPSLDTSAINPINSTESVESKKRSSQKINCASAKKESPETIEKMHPVSGNFSTNLLMSKNENIKKQHSLCEEFHQKSSDLLAQYSLSKEFSDTPKTVSSILMQQQKNLSSCSLKKSVSEPSLNSIMNEHKFFFTEPQSITSYEKVLFAYEIDRVNGEPVNFSLQKSIYPSSTEEKKIKRI